MGGCLGPPWRDPHSLGPPWRDPHPTGGWGGVVGCLGLPKKDPHSLGGSPGAWGGVATAPPARLWPSHEGMPQGWWGGAAAAPNAAGVGWLLPPKLWWPPHGGRWGNCSPNAPPSFSLNGKPADHAPQRNTHNTKTHNTNTPNTRNPNHAQHVRNTQHAHHGHGTGSITPNTHTLNTDTACGDTTRAY